MLKKGDKFETNFIISESIYNGFISIFKDCNPLHTESLYAKEKGFETKVMHGNILGGFLSYFIGECLPAKNVIIHSQVMNFCNPVYLNDELILKANLEEIFESVNAYEFKYHFLKKSNLTKVAKGNIQIGLL
jgi:3-hydroxybutyryl-CoA dehydratase